MTTSFLEEFDDRISKISSVKDYEALLDAIQKYRDADDSHISDAIGMYMALAKKTKELDPSGNGEYTRAHKAHHGMDSTPDAFINSYTEKGYKMRGASEIGTGAAARDADEAESTAGVGASGDVGAKGEEEEVSEEETVESRTDELYFEIYRDGGPTERFDQLLEEGNLNLTELYREGNTVLDDLYRDIKQCAREGGNPMLVERYVRIAGELKARGAKNSFYSGNDLERVEKICADEATRQLKKHLSESEGYDLPTAEDVEVLAAAGARLDPPMLQNTAENCSPEVVEAMIKAGADVNAPRVTEDENSGYTPLHAAAGMGRLDNVEVLLNNGADVNATNDDGETPMHYAASEGRTDIVQALIAAGADKEAKNEDGKTAADLLAEKIEKDREDGKDVAALEETLKTLRSAEAEGTTVNSNASGAERTGPGDKPAEQPTTATGDKPAEQPEPIQTDPNAASTASPDALGKELAGLLVKKAEERTEDDNKRIAELMNKNHPTQINLNVKDDSGRTPMHLAALHGRTDIVQALIKAGADKDATNNSGETPMHYAAREGRTDIVQALIEAGADKEAKTNYGETALDSVYRSLTYGELEGAENDQLIQTALYLKERGCKASQGKEVEALKKCPALMTTPDKEGNTMLETAAFNGDRETLSRCQSAGGNLGVVDEQTGGTLLHMAASNGHVDTVRWLAEQENGPDLNAVSKNGNTALDVVVNKLNSDKDLKPEERDQLLATAKVLAEKGVKRTKELSPEVKAQLGDRAQVFGDIANDGAAPADPQPQPEPQPQPQPEPQPELSAEQKALRSSLDAAVDESKSRAEQAAALAEVRNQLRTAPAVAQGMLKDLPEPQREALSASVDSVIAEDNAKPEDQRMGADQRAACDALKNDLAKPTEQPEPQPTAEAELTPEQKALRSSLDAAVDESKSRAEQAAALAEVRNQLRTDPTVAQSMLKDLPEPQREALTSSVDAVIAEDNAKPEDQRMGAEQRVACDALKNDLAKPTAEAEPQPTAEAESSVDTLIARTNNMLKNDGKIAGNDFIQTFSDMKNEWDKASPEDQKKLEAAMDRTVARAMTDAPHTVDNVRTMFGEDFDRIVGDPTKVEDRAAEPAAPAVEPAAEPAPTPAEEGPTNKGKPKEQPTDGKPEEQPTDGKPKEQPTDGKPKEQPTDGKPKEQPTDGKPEKSFQDRFKEMMERKDLTPEEYEQALNELNSKKTELGEEVARSLYFSAAAHATRHSDEAAKATAFEKATGVHHQSYMNDAMAQISSEEQTETASLGITGGKAGETTHTQMSRYTEETTEGRKAYDHAKARVDRWAKGGARVSGVRLDDKTTKTMRENLKKGLQGRGYSEEEAERQANMLLYKMVQANKLYHPSETVTVDGQKKRASDVLGAPAQGDKPAMNHRDALRVLADPKATPEQLSQAMRVADNVEGAVSDEGYAILNVRAGQGKSFNTSKTAGFTRGGALTPSEQRAADAELFQAAQNGDIDGINRATARGANLNAVREVEVDGKKVKQTPLDVAKPQVRKGMIRAGAKTAGEAQVMRIQKALQNPDLTVDQYKALVGEIQQLGKVAGNDQAKLAVEQLKRDAALYVSARVAADDERNPVSAPFVAAYKEAFNQDPMRPRKPDNEADKGTPSAEDSKTPPKDDPNKVRTGDDAGLPDSSTTSVSQPDAAGALARVGKSVQSEASDSDLVAAQNTGGKGIVDR